MGFTGKLLVVLVVFFAGFATAIYALAPADPGTDTVRDYQEPVSFPQSFTKSDQFAGQVNEQMRKIAAKASGWVNNR